MIDLTINGTARYIEGDLQLSAHADNERHCEHCGESIAEYMTGWEHDHTGSRWCHDLSDSDAADSDDATSASPAMSLPVNWAGITTNTDDESVRVEISVGDPRGCLTMTVRRVRDDDGAERLLLHVPHAGDSLPHVAMREIAPGTYQIG